MSFVNPLGDRATVLVTSVGRAEGVRAAAAALACAGADPDRAALLVDFDGRPPRPTLLASVAARELEERLVAHLPSERVAARGQLCQLAPPADPEGFEVAAAAVAVARGSVAVLGVPQESVQTLLASRLGPRLTGALLRADLGSDRALLALCAGELLGRGLAVGVLKQRLAWVAERRALFGALAPDAAGGLPARLVERLVGSEEEGERPSTGRGSSAGSAVPGAAKVPA